MGHIGSREVDERDFAINQKNLLCSSIAVCLVRELRADFARPHYLIIAKVYIFPTKDQYYIKGVKNAIGPI